MRQRYGVGTPRGLQGLAAARAVLSRHAGSAIFRFFASISAFLGRFSAFQAAGSVLGSNSSLFRRRCRFFTQRSGIPFLPRAGVAWQCSGAGAICCFGLQGLAGMIMEKGTLTWATADQSGVRMLGQKAVMLGIVCVGAAII